MLLEIISCFYSVHRIWKEYLSIKQALTLFETVEDSDVYDDAECVAEVDYYKIDDDIDSNGRLE